MLNTLPRSTYRACATKLSTSDLLEDYRITSEDLRLISECTQAIPNLITKFIDTFYQWLATRQQ